MKFRVRYGSCVGRHLRATEDIPIGTDVIVEKAYACASHEENLSSCCAQCQKSVSQDQQILCNHCNFIFCSKCEKQMDRHTRYECTCIEKLRLSSLQVGIDLGLALLIFRACISGVLQDQTTDDQTNIILQQLGNNNGSSFDLVCSLQTHIDDIDPEYAHVFRQISPHILHLVNELFPRQTLISETTIVELFCIVLVNAHGICAHGFSSDSGTGIFPVVSLLSHNCAPNCCFVTIENTIHVRSVEEIKSGDEITIAYVDLMLPTHLRRRDLLKTKFFKCMCARCDSPSECGRYLRAFKCKCGGFYVPYEQQILKQSDLTDEIDFDNLEDDSFDCAFDTFDKIYSNDRDAVDDTCTIWMCEKCESDHDWSLFERNLNRMIQNAIDMRQERRYKEVIEMLWSELASNSSLHENNYLIFTMLVQLVITLEYDPSLLLFEEKKRILESLIQISEVVLPRFHFEIAQHYTRYANLLSEHGDKQEYETAMCTARAHKQVVYSADYTNC
jgi:hypothetical protein